MTILILRIDETDLSEQDSQYWPLTSYGCQSMLTDAQVQWFMSVSEILKSIVYIASEEWNDEHVLCTAE